MRNRKCGGVGKFLLGFPPLRSCAPVGLEWDQTPENHSPNELYSRLGSWHFFHKRIRRSAVSPITPPNYAPPKFKMASVRSVILQLDDQEAVISTEIALGYRENVLDLSA